MGGGAGDDRRGTEPAVTPDACVHATAEKILELAKTAHFRYLEQDPRTSAAARFGAIELHLRSRKSLPYLH